MLKLIEIPLSETTRTHLHACQSDVDAKSTFVESVSRADQLWKGKSKSAIGAASFAEIKTKLNAMSACEGVCAYCEQNLVFDIEHIVPKSLFPSWAFVWDNYLMVCKNCNSGYKLDAMYVFVDSDSSETIFLKRRQVPSSEEIAFVHPRKENPMELLELDLLDEFTFAPRQPNLKGTRGYQKVIHTIEILNLNGRSISKYRAQAFTYYKNRLKEYVGVKRAKTHAEIRHAISGHPHVDDTKPLDEERLRILEFILQDIRTTTHPTVWQEMIRQRDQLSPKLQRLFADAPELIEATQRMQQ
jgi:uncharacterized protein (TIGR02646 family)